MPLWRCAVYWRRGFPWWHWELYRCWTPPAACSVLAAGYSHHMAHKCRGKFHGGVDRFFDLWKQNKQCWKITNINIVEYLTQTTKALKFSLIAVVISSFDNNNRLLHKECTQTLLTRSFLKTSCNTNRNPALIYKNKNNKSDFSYIHINLLSDSNTLIWFNTFPPICSANLYKLKQS